MKKLQLKQVTMLSTEIAKLTEKRHDHVVRDIRAIIDGLKDAPNLGDDFIAHKTEDKRGYTKHYALNKFAVELLLMGYNLELRAKVLRRVYDLEEDNELLRAALVERQSARLEAPELTAALKNARELEGKDTQGHHYSNEYNMINKLVLGMTAKQYISEHGFAPSTAIRDTMRPVEIQAITELQRANTSLIDIGIDYQERKVMLQVLYERKFKQLLIDEVMRIEA